MDQLLAYYNLIVFSQYFEIVKQILFVVLAVFIVYRVFTFQTRKIKLQQKAEKQRFKERKQLEKIKNKHIEKQLKHYKNQVNSTDAK